MTICSYLFTTILSFASLYPEGQNIWNIKVSESFSSLSLSHSNFQVFFSPIFQNISDVCICICMFACLCMYLHGNACACIYVEAETDVGNHLPVLSTSITETSLGSQGSPSLLSKTGIKSEIPSPSGMCCGYHSI